MNLEWVDSRKVLMAVACTALAWSLVRAPFEPSAATVPGARGAAPSAPARTALAPAGSHDLFALDAAAAPAATVVSGIETTPATASLSETAGPAERYRVRGTFQRGSRSTAVILDTSNNRELLREVGEKLGQAEVLEIGLRKVVVGWQGRRERLPAESGSEATGGGAGTSGR